VQAVKHIIIPTELLPSQCISYSEYSYLPPSHTFIAFFAQQKYLTMATLGYYPQTTVTTAGQYFPIATLGYYCQPTINAIDEIDEIATLKQQFRRQVQQLKYPKQNQVQRPAFLPRRNSNPITRGPLPESHFAIGSVVFIPSKEPSEKNCICVIPNCQRRHLDDRGYNHPAVVLDIQDERPIGELTALCCIVGYSVLDQLRYKL
jgi:hypothetical protein